MWVLRDFAGEQMAASVTVAVRSSMIELAIDAEVN
jgi:hypothetical protein